MHPELARIRAKEIVNLAKIFGYDLDRIKIEDGISYLIPKLDIALRNSIDSHIMSGIRCFANNKEPAFDFEKAVVAVIKRWY